MSALNKISAINTALAEWFILNKSVQIIPAKDLMPHFIKCGIFKKDHKNGLPIRTILRELDGQEQLHLIPYLKADRKAANTNWYFVRSNTTAPVPHTTTVVKKRAEIKPKQKNSRANSDEAYVIDLCDKVLGKKASRQHTFSFLLGDPNANGSQKRLPVDAFYPEINLAIEYCECQHTEAVTFFDRRQTVSGISRGEQRKRYDNRRKELLPKHDINLVVISYFDFHHDSKKRILRREAHDITIVKQILTQKPLK